jgi:TonB family protein
MRARVVLALQFVPFAVVWAQSDPTIPLRVRKPLATPVVVKGMPYSGEWQSDRMQVRADGTRIAETGVPRKEYRDSQGRMRRERAIPQDSKEGVRIVLLDDPASSVEYVLEPGKKVAHKFALVVSADPAARFPAPKSEELGVEVIRGLRAAGVRRTTTLPGGDLVVETWTAVDLQIMLREHTNDPLNGETNMRLTELRTDEPPAGLFQVPADYRTVDEAADFTIASPMRSHTTAPEVISRVAAKYTDEARRAGVHGIVLLSATIDGRGRARDVEVERGLDPGLDQEAIKAVQQWRFKPGEQDGHPVRVNVHVEVTFSLLN